MWRRSLLALAFGTVGCLAVLGNHPLAEPRPAADDLVIEWIRRAANPLETCEPRDDHHDLASLRQIVGDARLVALGEGTVGSREFVQLKHRIVRFLAEEMGFNTVAIQANMPEVRRINDYVLSGQGDPKALIAGLKYWPLHTEEMLEFVNWMRRFNASGRGPLQLVGVDMLKPDVPAEIVQSFLRRVDPIWADSADVIARAMQRARQAGARTLIIKAGLPATSAAGRRVRFSGWIRTQDVTGHAGLWCRADAGGQAVALDNMGHRGVTGTNDWQHYALEIHIPAAADSIVFGALMVGTGSVWFDSLAIEVDDEQWAGASHIDLAMESVGGPEGFILEPPPGYAIRMDDSTAAVGQRSLRLASVSEPAPSDAAMQWATIEDGAKRIVRRFDDEEARYRRASSGDEVEWVARNAHLILQRARMHNGNQVRDSSLAANVEWIMGRLPTESRIVFWAHNSTVARSAGTAGDWLSRHLGEDMVVFGFATNEGTCTMTKTTSADLEASEIEPGPEGSLERMAHASGIPHFLLDLRRIDTTSQVAGRLADDLMLRLMGPVASTHEFQPAKILHEYDVIGWVDRTRATQPLTQH